MVLMRLFEDFERTYTGRSDQGESLHSFFNRSKRSPAARVRTMCEEWFGHYLRSAREHDAADLRGRFTSKIDEQHYAAWFELFVREILVRLDFYVATHPELPGTTHRPDFKITSAGACAFVEATVVRRPTARSPYERDAAHKMLRLELENCFSAVTAVDGKLCRFLKRKELKRKFQKLFDEMKRSYDKHAYREPTTKPIRFDNWELTVEIYPATPGRRTQGRVIPLALDEFVEPSVCDVQRKIDDKKQKYGPAADPLIFAINVHALEFNSIDRWKTVLFDKNGIWNPKRVHRSTVTGVVFVSYADSVSILGAGIGQANDLCLFVNPLVDPRTLPPALLCLPHVRGPDGRERVEGKSVADILELD